MATKNYSFVARSYLLLCSFLLLSFCFSTITTAQQTVLLKPINVSQVALLPTEKLDFWNRLNALSYKKNLSVVKVGDVPSLQQNGVLTFTIPGIAATITAKAVRVEYEAEKQYIWQGRIDQAGYMSIVSTDDGMSGFIQLNNKYFVLYPLYKSYCALFEYNIAAMPADTCATVSSPPTALQSASSSIDYCAENSNTNCLYTVDVLVLITPEARTWIGGTFGNNWLNALAYVINGTETVNLAFVNSDINPRVRTRYAALNDFAYTDLADPDVVQKDVTTLVNSTTANNLREQYRADLVVMLTNDRYPNVAGATAILNQSGSNAYSIVEINSLLDPRFTYAHEIGHFFRADHNRSSNVPCNNGCGSDDGSCQHGWRFNDTDGIERRTIMALLFNDDQLAGDQRVLHYSNPDISFNGTATGTANNDNAKIIGNTSCEIANFRSPNYFSAIISGYGWWCTPIPESQAPNTYTAVVTEPTIGFSGTPPYTYQWHWNTSGIFTPTNPGILLGTSQSITINEALACPYFFLQLIVTSSEGISYRTTRKIGTGFCIACGGSGKDDLQSQQISQTNLTDTWQIIPNPANSSCRLFADNVPNGNYFIQLSNAAGKTMEQRNIVVDDESLNTTLMTDQLPIGIYTLTVVGNTSTISKKIIITH